MCDNDSVDVQLSLKHRSYTLSLSSYLYPHLLDCQGELSLSASLSFLFIRSFLPLSILLLMNDLSEAPVVAGCECPVCDWEIHSVFLPWKHLCLSSEWSPISDQRQCLPKLRDLSLGMREMVVFTLLHCIQWFLSETLCAEALAITQCSLHQSSNKAVATLAPAPIEPHTNSLPGGQRFPVHLTTKSPTTPSTQTHLPPIPPTSIVVYEEQSRCSLAIYHWPSFAVQWKNLASEIRIITVKFFSILAQ